MINQESKSSQVIKYEYVLIKTVWNYSMSPFQISLLSYFYGYGAYVPIEPYNEFIFLRVKYAL
jgi:hypothetical protein